MRRLLSAMLAIMICASFLTSCDNAKENKICEHKWEQTEKMNEFTAVDACSVCGVTRIYTDPESILQFATEEVFKMLRYGWDSYGIGEKEIDTCDLGYAILDCLSKLQETGEIIPKVSDDTVEVNVYTEKLPVAGGTVWLECGSVGLFRLNPEMTEICKVQTFLGEGKVLQMTDTLKELLVQAWNYHPSDYWTGSYKNGKVALQQVYKRDSAVEWVEIESIHIDNTVKSQNNTITLRIRANESKIVVPSILSYHSNDNLGSSDYKELELVNGEETTLEFTFVGFYGYSYSVLVDVDNTRILLSINP